MKDEVTLTMKQPRRFEIVRFAPEGKITTDQGRPRCWVCPSAGISG